MVHSSIQNGFYQEPLMYQRPWDKLINKIISQALENIDWMCRLVMLSKVLKPFLLNELSLDLQVTTPVTFTASVKYH